MHARFDRQVASVILFSFSALALAAGAAAAAPPTDSGGALAASESGLPVTERLRAYTALERVYYQHRIWPKDNKSAKPAFEVMAPRAELERGLAEQLHKAEALNRWWGLAPTETELTAEVARIERNSHDKATLHELYGALGNDPRLIREALAKPIWIERNLSRLYWHDERIHGAQREAAEKLHQGLTAGNFKEWGGVNYQRMNFILTEEIAPYDTLFVEARHAVSLRRGQNDPGVGSRCGRIDMTWGKRIL